MSTARSRARSNGSGPDPALAIADYAARDHLYGRALERGIAWGERDPRAAAKVFLGSLGIDWSNARNKRTLLALFRDGDVLLARADLTGAMDPDLLAASEIEDQGATFHFLLLPAALVRNPAKANPPRVFRPQKVVATLQKEARPAFARGAIIDGPEELMHALIPYMGSRATELFLALYINVRNQIVGYNEYSSGSIAEVEVAASGIFRDALLSGAAAVVTVHQHPTGDSAPSDADRMLWARLDDAGQIVGVPVLDNLVLGDAEYFSQRSGRKERIPADVLAEVRRQR